MSELVKVVEHADFTAWFEYIGNDTYLHVEVRKWNRASMKVMQKAIDDYTEKYTSLHAAVWNRKLKHFAIMFGFKDTGEDVIIKRHSDGEYIKAVHYIKENK